MVVKIGLEVQEAFLRRSLVKLRIEADGTVAVINGERFI